MKRLFGIWETAPSTSEIESRRNMIEVLEHCHDPISRLTGAHGFPRDFGGVRRAESGGRIRRSKFNDIERQYITPGKPMQDGFVESFNGSFRDET